MLMFNWKEIKNRSRGLTFDDVLLVPIKSEVKSRRDPSLRSPITRKFTFDMPIVSANMDTVTEADMAIAMAKLGGLGILHRFVPINKQVEFMRELQAQNLSCRAASIGVHDDDRARAKALIEAGCNLLTIDIAHGHGTLMTDTIKWLKDLSPSTEIIAGNVATPEGTDDLIQAGADAIKVGIGPGSMCTTRVITGCGVPQLTAISMCAEAADAHGVPIIADGGLRQSGDLVKAFAAGASAVMLGSMLSGTLETPGEIQNGRKHYRGMASKAAQVSWRGGVPEGMAPEGESTSVPVKGRVRDVITEVAGGIRSGMSYLNATQLSDLRNARFIEMSSAGVFESHAHGLRDRP